MVNCKFCGERMTSAPSHAEHEPGCGRAKLWEYIKFYTASSGGVTDPETHEAKLMAEWIDDLLTVGVRCSKQERNWFE